MVFFQRKILKEYEKLIYSMDVYQQKISEAERKRADLKSMSNRHCVYLYTESRRLETSTRLYDKS